MSVLNYLIYDNSLQRPVQDTNPGKPKDTKKPFPGQEALEKLLEKQYPGIARKNTVFTLPEAKNGIKKIMLRYSGSGVHFFAGLGEEMGSWNEESLMLIAIVAESAGASVYQWREILKTDVEVKGRTWSLVKEEINTLFGDLKKADRDTCVAEIYSYIVSRLTQRENGVEV